MVFLKRLPIFLLFLVVSLVSLHPVNQDSFAEASPFPVPSGLEPAIEFWKQIFTKYSTKEIVFYDPKDPSKIYKVMRVGKRRRIRSFLRRERMRIVRKHGLESRHRVWAQRGAKENFILGLERSERYMEQIQTVFRERGLPEDLAYLPLIESSFQIKHAHVRVPWACGSLCAEPDKSTSESYPQWTKGKIHWNPLVRLQVFWLKTTICLPVGPWQLPPIIMGRTVYAGRLIEWALTI